MELKFTHDPERKRQGARSNRTFMELKFTKTADFYNLICVLIVPLWN